GFTTCAATAALVLLAGCTGATGPEAGATGSAPSATASTPATEAIPTSTPAPTAPSPTPVAAPAPEQPPVLSASDPVSVTIPATGAESGLLHLGLRDNGSLEVPPEGPGSPASWYDGSPTPGERGPAVLLGHVNATGGGPGVFADLRALEPGDTIEVVREDGSTAVFAVDRGAQYGKADFPTLEVYGNTEGAELRLITCDGYDPATGEFDDNYVVYASLVP
ncbi:class F sortase, partial [Kocuria sp. NPDC057446]|uniref:class F sortase n=1 Tax=Kocuria sp. NPDC057446 TaxID=3346137 RepID=UPI00369FFAAC